MHSLINKGFNQFNHEIKRGATISDRELDMKTVSSYFIK